MSICSRRLRAFPRHTGAATLLALALAGASGCNSPLPSSYIVPGADIIPEGSAIDSSRGEIYTSSVKYGTVFRGRLTDSALTEFLPPGQDGRIQTLGIAVDSARNRVFVCGGGTGFAFVYDTRNGQLLGKFKTDVPSPTGTSRELFLNSTTLVNDVAVLANGDAFFTDSIRPILFRLPASAIGQGGGATQDLEVWRDFTGTALNYPPSDPNDFLTTVNANGIQIANNGQYFIIVQTNTGKLFRVTVADKSVSEIGGINSPIGAGLALGGNTLYVVSPMTPIKRFTLAPDFATGTEVTLTNPPIFVNSSSAVLNGGRLYVVNAQILTFIGGTAPTPPFIISAVTPP